MDELFAKSLDDMSKEELSDALKEILAAIYRKLRTEENFGYTQCCFITSIGSNRHDVEGMIFDADSYYNGVQWPSAWCF